MEPIDRDVSNVASSSNGLEAEAQQATAKTPSASGSTSDRLGVTNLTLGGTSIISPQLPAVFEPLAQSDSWVIFGAVIMIAFALNRVRVVVMQYLLQRLQAKDVSFKSWRVDPDIVRSS